MSYTLVERLRGLFVEFGPKAVMTGWNQVLQEFREALKEEIPKPKIVFSETIAPVHVAKDSLVVPQSTLTDKELYQKKVQDHKNTVMKKRQDQEAQGIVPESLLTEDNLKRWIQQEKKSYWVIAEETGCQDSVISAKAKSLGILSEAALMIKRKKASLK